MKKPTKQSDYRTIYSIDNEGKEEEIPAELYGERRFISSKKVIHPQRIPQCLEGLGISLTDLDVRGDTDFNQKEPADVRIRGGLEYFKPIHGKGYGINIGEHTPKFTKWAVCFHGVKNVQSIHRILQEGLKPGPGQAFASKKDVCGELTVPVGIYVTPWIKSTLSYVQHNRMLILQCLVDPEAIVMTDRKDYWVIKDPHSLVPYRIIHWVQPLQGLY